jgi:group I intron endonuclease
MYIYKTINLTNNKIYIGQTSKNNEDYFGSGPIILKAIKKYGKQNFKKEILEECKTKEETNSKEIYWINFYNSTNRMIGYNISKGGNGGNLGELVNKKISQQSYNHMFGNTLRKGKTPINKGIPMSETQKQKLKKPKTEEHKANLSKARIGRFTKKIICTTNSITYNSIKEAAEKLNLTVSNVVNVLKGRANKTKGFSFKYLSNIQ